MLETTGVEGEESSSTSSSEEGLYRDSNYVTPQKSPCIPIVHKIPSQEFITPSYDNSTLELRWIKLLLTLIVVLTASTAVCAFFWVQNLQQKNFYAQKITEQGAEIQKIKQEKDAEIKQIKQEKDAEIKQMKQEKHDICEKCNKFLAERRTDGRPNYHVSTSLESMNDNDEFHDVVEHSNMPSPLSDSST